MHYDNERLVLSLIEWRLIPWANKGFLGNGIKTYVEIGGERVECFVINKDGSPVSYVLVEYDPNRLPY